jgi:hypothetical protein
LRIGTVAAQLQQHRIFCQRLPQRRARAKQVHWRISKELASLSTVFNSTMGDLQKMRYNFNFIGNFGYPKAGPDSGRQKKVPGIWNPVRT